MTWRIPMLSYAEIWIFWARRYDFWQTLGSWTWITWLTFGKLCLTTETRGTGAMAGNRPKWSISMLLLSGGFTQESGHALFLAVTGALIGSRFSAHRPLFTGRTAPPFPESLGVWVQSPDATPRGSVDPCLSPLRRRARASS